MSEWKKLVDELPPDNYEYVLVRDEIGNEAYAIPAFENGKLDGWMINSSLGLGKLPEIKNVIEWAWV